jgi:serine/threonine protein kinase
MVLTKTPDPKTVRLQQELSSTYTIVERIGGGAMGDVFLANHKTLGGKWAIKVLAEELARDPVIVDRFIREAQIEANLQHPNIVKVFDISTKGDYQFLVMPFVEGEDLDERMKRVKCLDPVEAATIALHVTRALECAHEHGIIHRDLKPSNIRIDHYGTVVVMDFGIARVLDTGQGRTALGSRIGTPQYMSPEQSAGRPVDHRSDLYSLGVILYEMIAGENPFYTDNLFAIGVRHLTVTPPVLSTVRSDLKPGLSEIVDKLLAKDPSQRYQTAAELREALSPFGGGVEIRTPLPPRRIEGSAEVAPESLLRLGPLDAILHRIPEPDNVRDLPANEKVVLEFVDGVRSVREVLEQVPLDAGPAVTALESLQNDGFVYTEIPAFSEPLELPPTISRPPAQYLTQPPPPTIPRKEPSPPPFQRREPSPPPVKKEATPRPEQVIETKRKSVLQVVSTRTRLIIAASLLLVAIAWILWAIWPQPEPLAVQVDASPFASVTIKSSRGEVLANKEPTPFQRQLAPGTYTFEFVNGQQTRLETRTISSRSSNVIRCDFWNAEQIKGQIKNLLEPNR